MEVALSIRLGSAMFQVCASEANGRMEDPVGDVWMFVGLAVAISFVSYIVNDFRARLGRIEGKLNRILDRVYPEQAEERREVAWLAIQAEGRREGRSAWLLLAFWLLGVGAWLVLRS
jgi:hypothetical protein